MAKINAVKLSGLNSDLTGKVPWIGVGSIARYSWHARHI